ncbi:SPFH domain-containing protein [Streptomyces sp. KY75]|uniref:SPFH domain-containing protein n=1 Tax=Streptomyces sp. KY75 TaxID=2772433 RepID=UPI003FA7C46B
MTPDQNPHPLTDHDGRTSGGETPMPLVDDVALHRPALPTPPPLFRPKEEVRSAGDGLVGEDRLPVEDPVPVEAGRESPEDSEAPEGLGDPAPDPDPAPAPAPAAKPLVKPIRLVHPGRTLHLDQFQPAPAPVQPVRRLRTEPSAEWTPLPAYGEEAGPRPAPAPDAQTDKDKDTAPDDGPDTQLDLVLDLTPGTGTRTRATSATVSVPAPHPRPTPAATPSSPVSPPPPSPCTSSSATTRNNPNPPPSPRRWPAPPQAPEPPPTAPPPPLPPTPASNPHPPRPLADPRLVERPGPALPGYAALLTGAAGLLGVLALLWWRGALPAAAQSAVGLAPRPYESIGAGVWAGLALLVTVVVLALGGLGRGRVGYAWVLTLFGDYRGSVRRTGLVWVSPLLLRRRVDVRLRHWRSEPLPAVDANGTALRVVVLVVWRIKDTVRAALGIEDHEAYLSAQVESAMARVLSQLPADAFHEDAPTLRNAEAVGDALTRMLKADCEPVGVEVYSAQPTGIEYAPEVAAAMQRRRIAAIDAKHRDSVLTSVVDAVDDTVNRLTTRGIVDLDDYERKALVKDLTVAFYTGRTGGGDSA